MLTLASLNSRPSSYLAIKSFESSITWFIHRRNHTKKLQTFWLNQNQQKIGNLFHHLYANYFHRDTIRVGCLRHRQSLEKSKINNQSDIIFLIFNFFLFNSIFKLCTLRVVQGNGWDQGKGMRTYATGPTGRWGADGWKPFSFAT